VITHGSSIKAGGSNWMEGVLLLAVYAIMGLTFF
jgi:Ca2+/H+ antiporter